MRVLIANLKLLYQRRDFWYTFWPLLLPLAIAGALPWFLTGVGILSIGVSALALASGVVMAAGILSFSFAAMTVPELLCKPFLHCVPSHHLAVRRAVFAVVLAIGLGAVVLFLPHVRTSGWGWLWTAAAIFVAVAAFLLAFTDSMFISNRSMVSVLGFCPFLLLIFSILVISVASMWGRAVLRQLFVLYSPWIALGGMVLIVAHWIEYGRWDRIRRVRASGRLWGGVDFSWRARVRRGPEVHARERAESGVVRTLTAWFLRRMEAQPHLGYGRYAWGSIYTAACPVARWWKWFVIPMPVVFFICGYGGRLAAWVFALLFSWLLALLVKVPSRPVVFVPGGRPAMWRATVVMAGVVATAVLLYLTILVAASWVAFPLIPPVTIDDKTAVFRPMTVQILWAPVVLVPLCVALHMLLGIRGMFVLETAAPWVVMPAWVAITVLTMREPRMLADSMDVSGGVVLAIAICVWLVFVLITRRVCMRRSFVA